SRAPWCQTAACGARLSIDACRRFRRSTPAVRETECHTTKRSLLPYSPPARATPEFFRVSPPAQQAPLLAESLCPVWPSRLSLPVAAWAQVECYPQRGASRHTPCRKYLSLPTLRQTKAAALSRLGFLRCARRHTVFQFLCRIRQLVGNFPQKLRRALLRRGRYFFIQVFPQACNFVVQFPPELFEFVHRSSSPDCAAHFRYYRNAIGCPQ